MQASGEELEQFFATVMPHLNEMQRRVVAGAMARALGRGGKTAVADASGLSRNTVIKAQAEVEAGVEPSMRQRLPGAGDKPAIDKQPGLFGGAGRAGASLDARHADVGVAVDAQVDLRAGP